MALHTHTNTNQSRSRPYISFRSGGGNNPERIEPPALTQSIPVLYYPCSVQVRLVIDLQLLNHVPALEIGPVLFGGVERITEFHRFLSFSDDSCDFSDDSCHFCTPPPYC